MSDSHDLDASIQYAFGLLATIVSDLLAANRKTTAAGLKPALQKRTNGGFSESRLGFGTFREFLNAAERAGAVVLVEGPKDIEARPAATSLSSPTPRPDSIPTESIRPDLWRAFVQTRAGWSAWYDRDADSAFALPDEVTPLDPPHITERRGDLKERPAAFVPIQPIPERMHLDWMRGFSEQAGPSERPLLTAALDQPTPTRAFYQAVRGVPSLNKAWHSYRFKRVMKTVSEWREANSLNIEVTVPRPRVRDADSARRVEGTIPPGETAVRERLKSAIDRMPLAEVLRISIPVEYML